MPYLSVNVDYAAVIRQSRKTVEPDPVFAAGIAELAGAHGITAHLREDRRHIQDRDVFLLREVVKLPFNLEMAANDEMLEIATGIIPDLVTLVPEKRQEVTTEGGLDVSGNIDYLRDAVKKLADSGIITSMFIDPEAMQIDVSREIGAHCVEFHTGEYANATSPEEAEKQALRVADAAKYAHKNGLEVHAGHGLTYKNVGRIVNIHEIEGLYIGHTLFSRAIYVGLDRAVRDMLELLKHQ
jgi:pyridoxine 5-phosphate synthase